MSADNFIVIFKRKGKYIGYGRSASMAEEGSYPNRPMRGEHALFKVDTLEEAIKAAQAEYTEYGYYFARP